MAKKNTKKLPKLTFIDSSEDIIVKPSSNGDFLLIIFKETSECLSLHKNFVRSKLLLGDMNKTKNSKKAA
jgi:hypothetical protein